MRITASNVSKQAQKLPSSTNDVSVSYTDESNDYSIPYDVEEISEDPPEKEFVIDPERLEKFLMLTDHPRGWPEADAFLKHMTKLDLVAAHVDIMMGTRSAAKVMRRVFKRLGITYRYNSMWDGGRAGFSLLYPRSIADDEILNAITQTSEELGETYFDYEFERIFNQYVD